MNNVLSPMAGSVSSSPAGAQSSSPEPLPPGLADLNEIIHNNLVAARQKVDELRAIVRSDALPLVKGDASRLSRLFGGMINSILDHPPTGTKLFIYIRCEKDRGNVPANEEGLQPYSICIFTNIKTGADWMQLHAPRIQEAAAYMNTISGSLACHAINCTGCLYTVTLPGK